MDAERTIEVEVVYCLPHAQHVVALSLPDGATVRDAIRLSALSEKYPEIEQPEAKAGIYGRVVSHDTALRHGDRVEIYRPLLADPKQSRRRRAAAKARS